MVRLNKNWQLLLITTISLWSFISVFSLHAQPTMQPTTAWEVNNKSFLIDIQSVIPLDNEGNSLLLGYDAAKNIVILEADNKGGLKQISQTSFNVTFKVTAIQAINKEEALIAGLTGNETITYASINLKTGKTNWTKLLKKERKGIINTLIPNKEGILLAGKERNKSGKNDDIMLVFVDKEGNEKWYLNYGSEVGSEEILNGVAHSEGGFLLASYADDFNADEFYAFVLRINADGSNNWEKSFGTPKSSTIAYAVCEGENGSPIFAGNIDDDIRVTQLDKNHDTFWSKYISKDGFRYAAKGVTYSKDDHCYLYGNIYNSEGQVVSLYMTKLNGKKKIKPTPKKDEGKDDINDNDTKDKKNKKDKALKDKVLKFELVREGILQKVAYKNGVYTTPNQTWDVGDTYEFYTTRPQRGYLYLFSIDGNRKTIMHYPRKGKETVTQSKKIMIPNIDSSMIIEVGGLEYLLAVYSPTAIDQLERLLANIKKAKGPVRSGIIELLSSIGFQKDGVVSANDKMVINLEKSTSPIVSIIVELNVEKGKVPEKKKDKEDQPKNDTTNTTKPNLHILSIGLNDAGFSAPIVEFAEKDVIDFTNLVRNINQKDLFSSVQISNLIGKNATFEAIKKAIKKQNNTLKKEDIGILFISVPSKKIENTIRLLPANFNAEQINNTSLSYQQIVTLLNQTANKTIVFMDAPYDNALKLANENIVIISSANKGESVFEHQGWENSAFTVAMLEAFSNNKEQVNSNKDNVLTIKELFDYIKKRVLALTKEKYNKSQNPQLINEELNQLPMIKLD